MKFGRLVSWGFIRSKTNRRALVTLGCGKQEELLEISRKSRQTYGKVHKFEVIEETRHLSADRPPAWSKILLLQDLLSSGDFQTLFWMDADSMFVDLKVDLTDELTKGRLCHVAIHRHENQEFPNTGIMVLHQSNWTQEFLKKIYKQNDLINHRWWENASFLRLLGYTTEEPVKKINPSPNDNFVGEFSHRWNAFYLNPHPSPAVLHFPGMTHEVRVAAMKVLAKAPEKALSVMVDPNRPLRELSE
jgi:hypothetical protein